MWGSLSYLPFGNVLSSRSISTTSPITGGGDLSADRTLVIPAANSTTNGYLSSTDWSTFNAKANPSSKANADLTGQTAAVTSVCTYTPAANGTFRLGVYLTITAILTDVAQIQATYTDETNTSRTQIFSTIAGVTSLNSVGAFVFPTIDIRAKSGVAITVATVLTTSIGTIAYDVGAEIDFLR